MINKAARESALVEPLETSIRIHCQSGAVLRFRKCSRYLSLVLGMMSVVVVRAQTVHVEHVPAFENVNHPQLAYWFFAPNMTNETAYRAKIDLFADKSKHTMIFLTERQGLDFYDVETMHPILKRLVGYAHEKGLQIGLQVWKNDKVARIENTDRLIQEGEVVLDGTGQASYEAQARGARFAKMLIKGELFRIYAFRTTAGGFYDPSSFKDLTTCSDVQVVRDTVKVAINAGSQYDGYTCYILTQHYYQSLNGFSDQARTVLEDVFKAYSDIPFDGIALDEYRNMPVVYLKGGTVFRERLYSPAMARRMKADSGLDLDQVLFNMRYAPDGKAEVRMRAINEYMSLLRRSTLDAEAWMYDLGKRLYGEKTFIGVHNTFHNNLDRDEIWHTGVSWWNIKRDYGQTDEGTPLPIQMGVGMCYPARAMYNMYYDRHLDRIWAKALMDLRYGVRTHYHAANDVQGWGASIDTPVALEVISRVENAARLLNRFDPPLPRMPLLVIYGMESLCNWYPDPDARGAYDLNDKLIAMKRSVQLWAQGYLHAAVPTDVIEDGRLMLDASGVPVLNGHRFDAVILFNPQYAREATTRFFESYVARGGRLLVHGDVTHDFSGRDVAGRWQAIKAKAVATDLAAPSLSKLGLSRNTLVGGVENEEGSYTFTDVDSIKNDKPAGFSFTYMGKDYSGFYKGLAAIKVAKSGLLEKLAATGFGSLSVDGREVVRLSRDADLFLTVTNGTINATIADQAGTVKITVNPDVM